MTPQAATYITHGQRKFRRLDVLRREIKMAGKGPFEGMLWRDKAADEWTEAVFLRRVPQRILFVSGKRKRDIDNCLFQLGLERDG